LKTSGERALGAISENLDHAILTSYLCGWYDGAVFITIVKEEQRVWDYQSSRPERNQVHEINHQCHNAVRKSLQIVERGTNNLDL
jgi:hypothetical protein